MIITHNGDEVEATSEDRHIAGHAFHAKSVDEALAYVAGYRLECERDARERVLMALEKFVDRRPYEPLCLAESFIEEMRGEP